MKGFYLFSAVAIMTSFAGTVKADLPPEPFNLQSCLRTAGNTHAAQNRCYALNDCYINHSDNEGELKGCYGRAEEAYRLAVAGQPQPSAGAVVTSPVASDYDMKEGKGFLSQDANQGQGE